MTVKVLNKKKFVGLSSAMALTLSLAAVPASANQDTTGEQADAGTNNEVVTEQVAEKAVEQVVVEKPAENNVSVASSYDDDDDPLNRPEEGDKEQGTNHWVAIPNNTEVLVNKDGIVLSTGPFEGMHIDDVIAMLTPPTEPEQPTEPETKPEPEQPTEPETNEPIEPDVAFTDIAGHWAEPFIVQGARVGILKGYPDGTFKPNQHVTRAQAASLIVRALGLKADESAPFIDIKGYADNTQAEIAAAYQYNIIRGYSDGTFKPTEKVTRAQIALMLNRAYNGQTGVDYIAGSTVPYGDLKGYDEETINAIVMLYELGIATGSEGKYMPSDSTTRAHTAKMLGNFFGE